MNSSVPWYILIGFFVGSLICMPLMSMHNKNEERLDAERRIEMKNLGITEVTVNGVRIICQKGQNCICLSSWDNKQLTCNFKPE